jgi:hypothetical protein
MVGNKKRKKIKLPPRDKDKETLVILTRLIKELGFVELYRDIFVVMFQRDYKILKVEKLGCDISYYKDNKLVYTGNKFTNIEELIKD